MLPRAECDADRLNRAHLLFQISAGQRDKVLGYIKTAKKEGATIHCGGTGWDEAKDGYYVLPTIITDCDPSMQCVREEIFGPVVCVMRFSTEEEAIRLGEWSLTVFYLDRRLRTDATHIVPLWQPTTPSTASPPPSSRMTPDRRSAFRALSRLAPSGSTVSRR
jgi:hypothetical protein